LPPQA